MTKKTITTGLNGKALLRDSLLNKGTAFTEDERRALNLEGLLPPTYNTQDLQARRVYAKLENISDPLTAYVELASLQDRNEHLYYRILTDHLSKFLPIVYTPTVGLATQKFSEVFRSGRGLWITPAHRGRIQELLKQACGERSIRLLLVTDNEAILGIGDQGAGGMCISIGKLALYTACAGIDPAATLPISLDVGTDNQALLNDELYLGWRQARLRGAAYDELVEEFVAAVQTLCPDALIQWEDFRKDNALAILERYRKRVLSFNDDIQGTGAIALAGLFSGLRVTGQPLDTQRVLIHGAGAAGLGIARQITAALKLNNVPIDRVHEHLALLDSGGLLVDDRSMADSYKKDLSWPSEFAIALGMSNPDNRGLLEVIKQFKPTALIGTSGQTGAFNEEIISALLMNCERPLVMPLSNPTSKAEAIPEDIVRWTHGKAMIATGSPFEPVRFQGHTIHTGQGNNVFIFPALGLASQIVKARTVSDAMITEAAQALADTVTEEELESGLLYPDVERLREVTAIVATRVAARAISDGTATHVPDRDLAEVVVSSMWRPDYPEIQPC